MTPGSIVEHLDFFEDVLEKPIESRPKEGVLKHTL